MANFSSIFSLSFVFCKFQSHFCKNTFVLEFIMGIFFFILICRGFAIEILQYKKFTQAITSNFSHTKKIKANLKSENLKVIDLVLQQLKKVERGVCCFTNFFSSAISLCFSLIFLYKFNKYVQMSSFIGSAFLCA